MSDDLTIEVLRHELAEALSRAEAAEKERDALVMAVATKYPNETRYETALRYIRDAENRPASESSLAARINRLETRMVEGGFKTHGDGGLDELVEDAINKCGLLIKERNELAARIARAGEIQRTGYINAHTREASDRNRESDGWNRARETFRTALELDKETP